MIPLEPHAATYPRDLVYEVLGEVFDRVQDAMDEGATPPALQPSIDEARRCQKADQATKLDAALQDVAHAVISNLVRLRAAVDPRVTGR
jgi:hypothetical protein